MIHTKTDEGLEGNVLGRLNKKYNFLSRYIIILLYQNKSAGDNEIYYIYYRDRGILRAPKITWQCHLSFSYRQVRGKESRSSVGK
jgi:hypothetical protein